MTARDLQSQMSRRERQIMDIVYARGEASSTDILRELPDPPARGALRVMLRILEDKGHLRHRTHGREYIYQPTQSSGRVGPPALRRVLDTFFGGSLRKAVAAHLAQRDTDISDEELRRLVDLIRQARGKGV
jgi:BlaI family transcriptional regulator, penicillinase repressor